MEKDLSKIQKTIYLCNGTSCTNKGAEENITALRSALTENNLNDEVHTIRTKCSGFCKKGPIIGIQPENTWYQQMSEEKSVQVVTTHLLQNQFLADHILHTSSAEINFNSSPKKKSFFSKLSNLFSFFILLFSSFNTSAQSNLINTSLQYQFMDEKPTTKDGSVYSKPYTITDEVVRYTRTKYEISLAAVNLVNTKWDGTLFYDESQLKNEITESMDFHNTLRTPFAVRGSISYSL